MHPITSLTFPIASHTAQTLWRYLSTRHRASHNATTYLFATHTKSLTVVNNYLAIAQTDIQAAHTDASPVTNWLL